MGNKLVSVRVVSFNSAQTILDTLESIKNQTYQNIELVVSDDCSKDDTVELVNTWLEANKSRFVRTELITVPFNTGISANVNRSIRACHGEWIKGIAADDILLPKCIELCMEFISRDSAIEWLVGKSKKYIDSFEEKNMILDDSVYTSERLNVLKGSNELQRKTIVKFNFIEAPAVFIKTVLLREVGGCNEDYPLIEDWPLYKKLIFAGHKCYFFDEYIVGYRKSDNSVFNVKTKLFNYGYVKSKYQFVSRELYSSHNVFYKINNELHFRLCQIIQNLNMNNSHKINRNIYRFFDKMIDIITWKH